MKSQFLKDKLISTSDQCVRKQSSGKTDTRPGIRFKGTIPVPCKSTKTPSKNNRIDGQQTKEPLQGRCKTAPSVKRHTEKELKKVLPKLETDPKRRPRYKNLDGLFNILLQLSNTNLVHSPYFGCLSKVLNEQDLLRIRREKRMHERKCQIPANKFPLLQNGLLKRPISAPAAKCTKEIQTNVTHFPKLKRPSTSTHKPECFSKNGSVKTKISQSNMLKIPQQRPNRNILKPKISATAGKTTTATVLRQSVTKFPPVAGNTGPLQGSRATNAPRRTQSCQLKPDRSSTVKRSGNSLLCSVPISSRYWTNEIKNYYDWTSFCLMRRYRMDTKKLKEQLQQLGKDQPSINDMIWNEAEAFRKTLEVARKNLNNTLQMDKNKVSSGKPSKKNVTGTKPRSAGDIPRKSPEIQASSYLVPPPSAPDSLFLFRKEDDEFKLSIPKPPSVKSRIRKKPQTVDSSTLANDTLRSTSDDNIFAKYERAFKRNAAQLGLPVEDSDSTTDLPDSMAPFISDKKSKLKSKFTITNDRLSFDHLKRMR